MTYKKYKIRLRYSQYLWPLAFQQDFPHNESKNFCCIYLPAAKDTALNFAPFCNHFLAFNDVLFSIYWPAFTPSLFTDLRTLKGMCLSFKGLWMALLYNTTHAGANWINPSILGRSLAKFCYSTLMTLTRRQMNTCSQLTRKEVDKGGTTRSETVSLKSGDVCGSCGLMSWL